MSNFKKSQALILPFLLTLLLISPLLSSSIRPTYLYFIFNLLIISLGVKSGFLSSLSKEQNEKDGDRISWDTRNPFAITAKTLEPTSCEDGRNWVVKKVILEESSIEITNTLKSKPHDDKQIRVSEERLSVEHAKFVKPGVRKEKAKVAEYCGLDQVNAEEEKASRQSIFFIGCEESELGFYEEEEEEDNEGEKGGEMNGEELFSKAEKFIGNFYKQLKMQREDSWKNLQTLKRSFEASMY